MLDELVVAPLAARLDVARVHHEIEVVVPIEPLAEPRELRLPGFTVGHIANQRESEWRDPASPGRRLLSSHAPTQSEYTQQDEGTTVPFSHGDSLAWLRRSL